MRFISKHNDYDMVVRRDETAFRVMEGGTVTAQQVRPPLIAKFTQDQMLTTYERMYALQVFMSGETRPFGAMPDMQAQPIVDAMGRVVDLTNEYRPDFHFGLYDTETMCAPEDREDVEQVLLASKSLGRDFILVEQQRVAPPWPTYNECDLVTALNMCKHGGYNLIQVLDYESAHENREDWLIELGKLLAEQTITKSQDDSLTVTIK